MRRAGQVSGLNFTQRSFEKEGGIKETQGFQISDGEEKVLAKVKKAYETCPSRIERKGRKIYETSLRQKMHTHLWYAEHNNGFAYLCGQGEIRESSSFVGNMRGRKFMGSL